MTHTEHTDPVQVRRAYKFRAFPTHPQEGRSVRLLADHCDLYNSALEERREAWRMRRVSVSYGMQSAQLRDIRRADPDGQGRHSFTAQQQTLRRLSDAFAAFLKRAGNAERNPGKKPGRGEGWAEQEHPRRGLAPVHLHSRRESGGSCPQSHAGEPGRDQHHLPLLRGAMRPPPAGYRDLPRMWPYGRGHKRCDQHRLQGRAGL